LLACSPTSTSSVLVLQVCTTTPGLPSTSSCHHFKITTMRLQ
jgi:hypothetical protein